MSYSQQSKKAFENRSLKSIYPEVEQRKKYVQKKLLECKLVNPALVRIEAYQKSILSHVFVTLMMDRKTKMAEVYGHLHKKVLKLSANDSLYLIANKSIVILNDSVDHLISKSSEEDGILYLLYAESNPFGYSNDISSICKYI